MIQFVNIKLFEHCVLFNEILKRFAKGETDEKGEGVIEFWVSSIFREIKRNNSISHGNGKFCHSRDTIFVIKTICGSHDIFGFYLIEAC